jgi:hypothetical protein
MRGSTATTTARKALADRAVEQRIGGYRQMHEEHGALTPIAISDATDTGIQVDARDSQGMVLSLTSKASRRRRTPSSGLRVNLIAGGGPARGGPATDACVRSATAGRAGARGDAPGTRSRGGGGFVLGRRAARARRQAAPAGGERESGSHGRHAQPRRHAFQPGLGQQALHQDRIAQLAEKGKLSLSDPLTKWIPDWPGASASKITIAMLVGHRAGIPDIFGANYDAMDRSKLRHNRDFIPLFRNEPLWFEPGTSQRYSNGSYVLLGENHRARLGPGLLRLRTRSRLHAGGDEGHRVAALRRQDPNVAMGYTRGENGQESLHDNTGSRPARGSGRRWWLLHAGRPAAFDQALMANQLCSPGWTEWIKGGPAPTDARTAAASPSSAMKPSFGFAGGAPGISAEYNREGAYTLIVLGNFDPPYTQAMRRAASAV